MTQLYPVWKICFLKRATYNVSLFEQPPSTQENPLELCIKAKTREFLQVVKILLAVLNIEHLNCSAVSIIIKTDNK